MSAVKVKEEPVNKLKKRLINELAIDVVLRVTLLTSADIRTLSVVVATKGDT